MRNKRKNKKYAVGMVVCNRWELTKQSLDSLFYSQQKPETYDFYIIDNGSAPENIKHLKKYLRSIPLPLRNLLCIPSVSISKAWNLFLLMAKNYDYRIKYDNDIVLYGTLAPKIQRIRHNMDAPGDFGTNPGAVPSGPPLTGAGSFQSAILARKRIKAESHTRFIDHMIGFSKKYTVDLVSLVPIHADKPFRAIYQSLINSRKNDAPYLSGGCMMITKKCFDKIGYFHEMLAREIDVEYSQRAFRNDLNIGYHPLYCVKHIGYSQPTENTFALQAKQGESAAVLRQLPVECFADTGWKKIEKKLVLQANDAVYLTLE